MSVYQKIATLQDEVVGPMLKEAWQEKRGMYKFDQEHPLHIEHLVEMCNQKYGLTGNQSHSMLDKDFRPILWTEDDVTRALNYIKKKNPDGLRELFGHTERRLPVV